MLTPGGAAPQGPLDAAIRIGRALCRSACWDGDRRRCNWVGRSADEPVDGDGRVTPTVAALGEDLYAGSAGTAFFLAHLFDRTGEEAFRATALGAIRRSIRPDGRLREPSVSPVSFYRGELGVAFAADRVGALTGCPEAVAGADALLDRVAGGLASPHLLDVIHGSAGAIPALLALARRPGRARCRALAVALGEELLRAAVRRGPVWEWAAEAVSGPGSGPRLLTGFSHGASGIGWALLELHAAGGRDDVLDAARGAFAYEDALFHPDRDNWPDLRPADRPAGGSGPTGFTVAWCHGAPGIALARARAAVLDPARQEGHAAVARRALATITAALERSLGAPGGDSSLCHGRAGLMDVVLTAGRLLGDGSGRAPGFGRALVAEHSGPDDWPSGVPSRGPNPSLMLGTAGVGLALLRLHDPGAVPSALLVTPETGGPAPG